MTRRAEPAFSELLAHPGVTERLVLRSRFGFMAVHGGSLERGTAELARAAADTARASLYTVEQPADLRWHLPSRLVGPEASTQLASFLAHVDVAVSLHGYSRAERSTTLLVGGSNRAQAARAADVLRAALTGYEVVDDLEEIPMALRGLHPDNPVNRPREGGVQLELPQRVRGFPPAWAVAGDPAPPPDAVALIAALAALAS